MEIQFLGATKTVTGSKCLLKTDKNILVDCGLFQGLKELRLRNWSTLPIDPANIDAVVLTHAHLDHSGYLPLLVKNGFRGKIYATPLTVELCKILLLDSGHLQEEEAYHANKYGYAKHQPALPLYTRKDALAVFPQLDAVSFHQNFSIGSCSFCFHRAGHILGAASLMVCYQQTSVLFSGDLGRTTDRVVLPPENILVADYLVVESTYGDRLHENIDPEESLGRVIKEAAKNGGTVIIPAFALGRAQTILYHLYRLKAAGQISNIPIFLDSPMAQEVTEIMLKHPGEHLLDPKTCLGISKMVHYVSTIEESKKIDSYTFPKVIISASGMATGGRVLHHLKALASDSANVILFAGYQAVGTRGDHLLRGYQEIKIFGNLVTVNAKVIALSNVSAHADYQELLDWLGKIKTAPRKIFITHGDPDAAEALKKKIATTFAWPCVIPEYLQVVEL